jgi:hypothetical protein
MLNDEKIEDILINDTPDPVTYKSGLIIAAQLTLWFAVIICALVVVVVS